MKTNFATEDIGKIFDFDKGILQSSKNSIGVYPFITASEDYKSHNEFHYDCEALCFAFAASGSLGRTHYVKGKFAASDLVYILTPKKHFKEKINLKFYHFYFTHFRKGIVAATKSGTSKVSINREAFKKIPLPIPSIQYQENIVSIIEEVDVKINDTNRLLNYQYKELDNLLHSKYSEIVKDVKWQPMEKVAPLTRRDVAIIENELYPELGIRSFGKGTFHKPAITGLGIGTKKLYQIKEGDLLFSNVFAWEGAIAIARKEDNDRYGSHRFISCVTNDDVLTEFLCYHFLSPQGLNDVNLCSPGGAGRNRTLGLQKLMNITVPVPDIELHKISGKDE